MKMTTDIEEDLTRRGMAAWFRAGGTEQPSNASGVELHDKAHWVVLRSAKGVLAVYRVRILKDEAGKMTGTMLKLMKRPPKGIK